jgi:chitodextrinase
MKTRTLGPGLLLTLAVLAAACTMQKNEEPPLAGPSEFGKSINMTITPDSIQQDGASQSLVTITALGTRGEPLANVLLRAEIRVDNVSTDFGTLSARNLVTNGSGRATLVYTAPATPSGLDIDTHTVVQIGITPTETDFGNASTRFASLRLLPPGRIESPRTLSLSFSSAGTSTGSVVDETATFTVNPPPGVTIVRYFWSFGDGATATTGLPSTTHSYSAPGTFAVSVTAEDTIGRTGTATTSIGVEGAPLPEADFVVSPTNPQPGETVRFNAAPSTPAPGRTIVGYSWDFGNGSTGSGPTPSTQYGAARSYTVTLVVTDDRGRTDSVNRTITVSLPAPAPTPLTTPLRVR